MYTQNVTIRNADGLSAQKACLFIQKANEFPCELWLEINQHRINAKSLLGILSLGIQDGTSVTLIADGSQEQDAVQALSACCGV